MSSTAHLGEGAKLPFGLPLPRLRRRISSGRGRASTVALLGGCRPCRHTGWCFILIGTIGCMAADRKQLYSRRCACCFWRFCQPRAGSSTFAIIVRWGGWAAAGGKSAGGTGPGVAAVAAVTALAAAFLAARLRAALNGPVAGALPAGSCMHDPHVKPRCAAASAKLRNKEGSQHLECHSASNVIIVIHASSCEQRPASQGHSLFRSHTGCSRTCSSSRIAASAAAAAAAVPSRCAAGLLADTRCSAMLTFASCPASGRRFRCGSAASRACSKDGKVTEVKCQSCYSD